MELLDKHDYNFFNKKHNFDHCTPDKFIKETLIPLADFMCTFILLPVYDLLTNLLTGVNSLDTMHSHASSRLQRKR